MCKENFSFCICSFESFSFGIAEARHRPFPHQRSAGGARDEGEIRFSGHGVDHGVDHGVVEVLAVEAESTRLKGTVQVSVFILESWAQTS